MKRKPRSEFIIGAYGPSGMIAFFEQDDKTGYLYLAERDYSIKAALHIYNRTETQLTTPRKVKILWTSTGHRCGVVINGALRGVIGVNGDLHRPAGALVDKGVVDPKWKKGFTLP